MVRAIALLCFALLSVVATRAQAECTSKDGKRLWLDGAKSYNLGNYEDAAKQWEAAYLICTDPEILFNLAQAHRKMGHLEKARDLFKSWLRENPAASEAERSEVSGWVNDLETKIADEKRNELEGRVSPPLETTPIAGGTPPAPAVSAPTMGGPMEPRVEEHNDDAGVWTPWYQDGWGWILVGGGAAALLGGAGVVAWSQSITDEARTTVDQAEAARMFDDAESKRTIGAVSMIAGGALVAGGVLRFAWGGGSERPRAIVSLRPGSLLVWGTF